MPIFLLALRSLTYAQRAQEALSEAGISSRLLRTPASVTPKGCSHSLRVEQRDLDAALSALRGEGFKIEKLFRSSDGVSFAEVEA